MWWFTLEGCKQPWPKSSQTWRDWTWDCRSKWNIYCHKCIRSENLQLYMEKMHLCTYWKCYLYNHVGCRHGLAQWAVNMFQGELYGYANFIHQKKMIPASVNYFWEDIVCKYWKWAEKAGGLENCGMKPALSVMHAKAHSWTCQVWIIMVIHV